MASMNSFYFPSFCKYLQRNTDTYKCVDTLKVLVASQNHFEAFKYLRYDVFESEKKPFKIEVLHL